MSDMPHPREILRGLEQRARKRFGQNFLVEPQRARHIALAAGVQSGDRVVEIGPGLGMLTEQLVDLGAEVVAVELDRDLASYLRRRMVRARIVEADATQVDWSQLCPAPPRWQVVANLPFNIGTPLVVDLVERRDCFDRITVMLQSEVVARLTASPGSRAYGSLTVRMAARASVRRVMSLPPGAFHPRPKVGAAVARLELRDELQVGPAGAEAFDRCVKAAFSQRRKTLLNALSPAYGREQARAALVEAELEPRLRAERVDPAGFARLAAALSSQPSST